MSFFVVVEHPNGSLIPIIKGDGGPSTDCLATWETREAAKTAMADHTLVKAYGALIFDTEEASCC